MHPRGRGRGRGLVENEEQDENKKVVEEQEQEQEEGSETETETGFMDLDPDTLHNVLKRVDVYTLGRAACVNKMWRKTVLDDRLLSRIFKRIFGVPLHPFRKQEEGRETGFGDLKKETLVNVLKRVDVVTLGRAASVNKRWLMAAWDDRIWEPMVERIWVSTGCRSYSYRLRNPNRVLPFRLLLSNKQISDYVTAPSDFYSIDFSKKIGPWKVNI